MDAAALRDELTRQRLEAAAQRLAELRVLDFEPDWWDGQAHAPCLVVRGGRRERLQRVVETGGDAVIVPFQRRSATRWLAARRRGDAPQLMPPAPTALHDIVVDTDGDVARCRTTTCGALLPVGYEGDCPVCGAG